MVSFKKVKDKLFTLVQNKIVQDFNSKFSPWAITYYHTLKMKNWTNLKMNKASSTLEVKEFNSVKNTKFVEITRTWFCWKLNLHD